MSLLRPRRFILAAIAVACLCAGIGLRGQTGALNGEWRAYGGDTGHTRYSPLDQINADEFQQAHGRVALQDRSSRAAARVHVRVDAGDGQRRAVFDCGQPASGRRARSGNRRGAVDAQRARRSARRRRAAPAFGARPRVLDRRQRGTDSLRHAGLSARRAEREDRHARPGVRRSTASST